MSWIKTDNYRSILKVIAEEEEFSKNEYQFTRTPNLKYMSNKKELNNKLYIMLMNQMELSTMLSMLITSKRLNIFRLCEQANSFIESKNPLMLVITLRSMIERIAYYYYFIRQSKNLPIKPNENVNKLQKIRDDLRSKVVRGLYQTSSEIRWMNENTKIREMKLQPYVQKDGDDHDRSTLNILTPIKQLDKKIKGAFNCYSILSEFLHPNYGDLELASSNFKLENNEFGDELMVRKLGLEKSFTDTTHSMLEQSVEIVDDICRLYLETIDEIQKYALNLNSLERKFVHGLLKENGLRKIGLRKGSKCPCLSGRRIKDCVKL